MNDSKQATQTVDLASWLTRIWDEEESAAKACEEVYPSPWEVSDRGWMAKVQADKPGFPIVAVLEQHPSIDGWLSTRLDHLAFHDPASALARIAADRKILHLYEVFERSFREGDAIFSELGRVVAMERLIALELVVRHLASPYKGREGWQEAWE